MNFGNIFQEIQQAVADFLAFQAGQPVKLPGFSQNANLLGNAVTVTVPETVVQKESGVATSTAAPSEGFSLNTNVIDIALAVLNDFESFVHGKDITIPQFSEVVNVSGTHIQITIGPVVISHASTTAAASVLGTTSGGAPSFGPTPGTVGSTGSSTVFGSTQPLVEGSTAEEKFETPAQEAFEDSHPTPPFSA